MYRILWIAADRGALGSYRCYCPAYALQDEGLADSDFLFHDQLAVSDPTKELAGIDLVVFQRCVSSAAWKWMQAARALGCHVIFELDDDLFDVPRHNPAGWYWWKKPTQRLLRQELTFCDHVLVSTVPLAQTVQTKMGWRDRTKMTVCPNHLHPVVWGKHIWYDVHQFNNQDKIVIGWQGSTTHNKDFGAALPALRRILEEFPTTQLRLFGDVPACVKGVIPDDRFWWTRGVQFEVYPPTLRYVHFDIGIAPITNSAFNQSKSNLKYLEYAALELPCVASRVYPYAKTIEEGVNGFLAEGETEWYEKLRCLVMSGGLRQEMGRNAFHHVWERYSYHTAFQAWQGAFQGILGDQHARPELEQPAGTLAPPGAE